jgi:hypothetical protein
MVVAARSGSQDPHWASFRVGDIRVRLTGQAACDLPGIQGAGTLWVGFLARGDDKSLQGGRSRFAARSRDCFSSRPLAVG